jgi:APA family basic amino acid/polyamine antiporter
MSASNDDSEETVRGIGRWGALSTVAGSMVGIGIFLVPPLVAEKLPTVAGFSSVWVVAAVTALAGAASYAELGGMYPHAGGDYRFQHEAYGGSVAFASGWLLFGGIFTGSVAALAVPLCEHQLSNILDAFGVGFAPGAAVPWTGLTRAQLAAMAVVVGLTALNSFRVEVSSGVQTLTTLVPVAALTVGGGLLLLVGTGGGSAGVAPETNVGWAYAADWVEAYGRVYFVFSGWNAVIYVAGEVRDPGETLPFGLVGGTVLVTAVYAVLCAAFLVALGFGGLAGAQEAGTAAAKAFAGPTAGTAVAAVVGVAILASLNATVLGGARVCYAMAERGAFLDSFGELNSFGVPMRALWIQAAGACVLIATGTFRQILDLVVLAMMLVGILTVSSLWVFRSRCVGTDRLFRVPLFPVVPSIYIAASAGVVVAQVATAVASGAAEDWYPVYGIAGFVAALVAAVAWDVVRSPDADSDET